MNKSERVKLRLAYGVISVVLASVTLVGCFLSGAKRSVSPPGKTSIGWDCDISYFGVTDSSSVKRVNFTWLPATADQAGNTSRIMASNSLYDESSSSVIFVVDNEMRKIDQIRDINGSPLQFDLNSKYVEYDKGMAQIHMRIGSLILDSSARALQVAAKGSAKVTFFYEAQEYQFSSSDTVPAIENYSKLPKDIFTGEKRVCTFAGYNSGGP